MKNEDKENAVIGKQDIFINDDFMRWFDYYLLYDVFQKVLKFSLYFE